MLSDEYLQIELRFCTKMMCSCIIHPCIIVVSGPDPLESGNIRLVRIYILAAFFPATQVADKYLYGFCLLYFAERMRA